MPLFRCFAAWLACSASVEGRSCPTSHTHTHTISCPFHTYLGGERGGGGVRFRCRVEPGSTRLSLLAEQAPHARCPKVPKFHKLLVRFTRFSPTCPGLPYFGSPPPFYHYYLAYRDTASCFARNADSQVSESRPGAVGGAEHTLHVTDT